MLYFSYLRRAYHQHIQLTHEEPRFLVMTSFTTTFIIARIIVYGTLNHILPKVFSYVSIGGVHVHHIVWGVLLLLVAGFIRVPQFEKSFVNISSILYGIGAALTLDEFALLIHFDPLVYFGPQGRLSLDVVFIFFLLCLGFLWHGRFWHRIFMVTFLRKH